MNDETGAIRSSGNVFADLGVSEPDDALAKAKLAFAIGTAIAQRCLTQTDAAALLGINQPKISALVHGRLTGFSIERLLRFLLALSYDVEITIQPAQTAGCRGQLRVTRYEQSAESGQDVKVLTAS